MDELQAWEELLVLVDREPRSHEQIRYIKQEINLLLKKLSPKLTYSS